MQMQIEFPQGKQVNARLNGFTIATDQPVKQGGEGKAPSPYELFLSSLGTCAGIFVLSFCQSRKIPIDGVRMTLTFGFNPKEHIVEQVDVNIRTPPDFPEKYRPAIIRAVDQCAVKKSLALPPQFSINVQ
jgi:putative redox protein